MNHNEATSTRGNEDILRIPRCEVTGLRRTTLRAVVLTGGEAV